MLIICAGLVWAGSAQAQVLADNQRGSVLVFPKWVITAGKYTVLRIVNASPDPVNVVVDLVTPGDPFQPMSICNERDVRLALTGKDIAVIDVATQFPPGPMGFAIAYAVGDLQQANEIKHNHLIGTAIISDRVTRAQESLTAVAIQALAPNGDGQLAFDNVEYLAMPSEGWSDFMAARLPAEGDPGGLSELTLLTLDMVSGQDNTPVDVDVHVYDSDENYKKSIPLRFTCWTEVELSSRGLDPVFDAVLLGTREGFVHIALDSGEPVLGAVEEFTVVSATMNPLRHDDIAVATTFTP